MIIYIHGFRSSGAATKASITKEYFADKKVLCPSLPISPYKAFSILKDLVRDAGQRVNLIGSSLGGFYALMLGAKYGLKSVLINPVVDAHIQLKSAIGKNTYFDTGEEFDWTEKEINELEDIYLEHINQIKLQNILLAISKDDEVVDSARTLSQLKGIENKIELDNCGHQFSRYREILPDIRKFFYGEESLK